MARTAMPASVRSRNQVSGPSTSGTAASRAKSLPLNTTGETLTSNVSHGVWILVRTWATLNQSAAYGARPGPAWARPMVATVSISRGAVASGRTTKRSNSAPLSRPASVARIRQTIQG
jgi:hypothetical protein